MIKRQRELAHLAVNEGLTAVEIIQTNGNHFRIEGQYHGKLVKIITPYSPSCHRTMLNVRGNIRRAMRSIDNAVVRK